MKKTTSLLLALLLVLCTVCSVTVMAEEAPVITDAYIGGFPVIGEYLHVVVDGTYNGAAFEESLDTSGNYAVSATYQWQYGEGETWTDVTSLTQANRICAVSSSMADKYVRCIVTPKVGDVTGAPVTVTFPTKISATGNWVETVQREITFDSESDLDLFQQRASCTLSYDAEKKAMKISDWPLSGDVINNDNVGWTVKFPITARTDSVLTFQFDHYTDQGKVNYMQMGVEGSGLLFTSKTVIADPVRGGFYANPNVASTSATARISLNIYELTNNTWHTGTKILNKNNPSAIMTSAMLLEKGTTQNVWFHPHKDSAVKGAQVVDGATAIYCDNVKVIEKTIPYNMTVTSGGETVAVKQVASGARSVDIPVETGKKLKTITVNGEDKTADLTGNSVSVKPVYQDFTVDVTYEDLQIDRLSLEKNQTTYVGTDRAAEALTLLAYDADGVSYDLTGLAGVTYTSSDDSVFTFTEGNKLKSTGKNGKALITASYNGKSGSVMMIRQPKELAGQDEFAGSNYAVQTDANLSGYSSTAKGGHFDEDVLTATKVTSWQSYGFLGLRHYLGRFNWFNQGYRSAGCWFYDDGLNQVGAYFEISDCKDYTKDGKITVINENLSEEMGYGGFASKWESVNGWRVNLYVDSARGGTHYQVGGTAVKERTVGWHQLIGSLEKDPASSCGWYWNVYIDGELVRSVEPVLQSMNDPHFELRNRMQADPDTISETNATLYPFYWDDTLVGGSLGKDVFGIQYEIDGSGTVTAGDAAKESGSWDYITEGVALEVTLTPAANYEISAVSLDDQKLTPNASGAVTLSNVTKDSVLKVTFGEKAPVDPEFAEDATYNWFKTVDDKPTVYVYSKLNDFTTNGSSLQYGIKIWVKGQEENKLTLPARQPSGLLAEAAPGQAYAIKAYGDAITSDGEYMVQPYVGETEGTAEEVTFNN